MGTIVIGGLGPGLGGTINPFDPDYEKKVLAADRQARADAANAKLATEYMAHALQIKEQNIQNVAVGKGLATIDPPPHKWVIDANGNQVQSTDLVCAAISVVPDPPTPGQAAPGQFVSTNVPADRIDVLTAKVDRQTAMLLAIAQKLGLA